MKLFGLNITIEDKNSTKGNEFEELAGHMFSPKYFKIIDWTKDHCRTSDLKVESDTKPDFIIEYMPTKEKFAVECKYRSNIEVMKNNYGEEIEILEWSYPTQLERYKTYEKENNIPVFIVIGLMGTAKKPEYMFCIPLNEIKYPKLYGSVLKKYERDPKKNFFWDTKTKKLS